MEHGDVKVRSASNGINLVGRKSDQLLAQHLPSCSVDHPQPGNVSLERALRDELGQDGLERQLLVVQRQGTFPLQLDPGKHWLFRDYRLLILAAYQSAPRWFGCRPFV